MISTLYVLPARFSLGERLVRSISLRSNGRFAGHLGAHPLLDCLEVGRRQRPRQVEVVVEAVADGRTDPELRLREELEHGRRHDVRGRVAHRVEPVVRAGIQQLLGVGSDLVRVNRHAAKRTGVGAHRCGLSWRIMCA